MLEYIEREAAMDAVKHAWAKGLEPSQYVEELPCADVAPVAHGRWRKKYDLYDKGFYISSKIWWECSCCGMKTDWKDESFSMQVGYNYCPNCGARMDGDGK